MFAYLLLYPIRGLGLVFDFSFQGFCACFISVCASFRRRNFVSQFLGTGFGLSSTISGISEGGCGRRVFRDGDTEFEILYPREDFVASLKPFDLDFCRVLTLVQARKLDRVVFDRLSSERSQGLHGCNRI